MSSAADSSPSDGTSRKTQPVFQAVNGGMQASVFDGEYGLSVSLTKRYRDGNEWKSAKTLFPGDLPNAIRALSRCLEFCESQ